MSRRKRAGYLRFVRGLDLLQPLEPRTLLSIVSFTDVDHGPGYKQNPDSAGAVGPNHTVSFDGLNVVVQDKITGQVLLLETQATFWTNAGQSIRINDPRIVYDPVSARWFAAGQNLNDTLGYLAVSSSSDPLQPWHAVQLPTTATDLGVKMGVDRNGLYIAYDNANPNPAVAFNVLVMPIADAIAAGGPITTHITTFTGLQLESTPASDPDPNKGTGPNAPEVLINKEFGNTASKLYMYKITWSGGTPSLSSLQTINLSRTYQTPNGSGNNEAPQPSPGLPLRADETRRTMNAFEFGGNVYASNEAKNTLTSMPGVLWYEVSATTGTLLQEGFYDSTTKAYIAPTITVDGNGNVALGATETSATEFPSVAVMTHLVGDAPGTLRTPVVTIPGTTYYRDSLAHNPPGIAWGNYSSTIMDPSNPLTFWTLQEYAGSTVDQQWTVGWSSFQAADVAGTGTIVTLSATDPSASEIGPDNGVYTFTRTGATTAALTVNYTIGGTAITSDYTETYTGSVVIPIGSTSTTLTLTPVDDSLVEGSETVILTLAANANYTVGFPSTGTVTIADSDSVPAAPTVLSASAVSNAINLAWTDNANNETGFHVWRSTTSGSGFATIGSPGVNATTFSDTTAAVGTTYYYYVTAFNAIGDSAPSNTANATIVANSAQVYDGFNYTVGNGTNLAGHNTGIGLGANWAVSNNTNVTVLSGSLNYSASSHPLTTLANSVQATAGASATATLANSIGILGTSLWISFEFQTYKTGTSGVLLGDLDINPSGGSGTGLQIGGAFNGNIDARVTIPGVDLFLNTTVAIVANTTYFVVAHVQYLSTGDIIDLFVNPTPGVTPTTPSGTKTLPASVVLPVSASLILRSVSTSVPTFDEIRIGSAYLDVAPSDTTPPTITAVYASSTTWTQAFLNNLANTNQGSATLGYKVSVGANQLQALPWATLNQLSITFSEDVSVQQAALSLTGLNVPSYSIQSFNYSSGTHTATWTLASFINNDTLTLSIPAANVTDLANNQLDGEWTDSVSTTSGNGTAGGNFIFHLNVLPADINRDNIVDGADFDTWFTHLLNNTYSPTSGDLNADGLVDGADYDLWFTHLGSTLPSQSLASQSLTASTPLALAAAATFPLSPTTANDPLTSKSKLKHKANPHAIPCFVTLLAQR